ncbi:MAG TPA: branched-chain amino acid ABC transporter permease [Alphaproteobacteria bacterium]|nr:branched-chain amino acid ABC transporter permease [Alphaproteobacteria bacterium]
MKIGRKGVVAVVALVALAALPPIALALDQDFYIDMFTRIMIFAIAAVSLDLILGYGGLVSFGHAAYLGIGSYAVGILAYHGFGNGFLQFGVAILASAVVALFVGWVSLRTSGVYFIMITLAFGQMIYFLGESINLYGGDNGLNIQQHSDFAGLLDLDDSSTLYYFVLAWLVLCLGFGWRLVNSRFGMVIRGAKSNERRMLSLGFRTFRYKLLAFVISGAIAGIAGALLANLTLFLSPSVMHWTRSGEVMMMVILGGMGTLIGPVFGAIVYLLFESLLSGFTEHWQAILGPFLVLVVLFSKSGLMGFSGRGGGAAAKSNA